MTLRGERPRTLRGTARGKKQTGEADRALSASHKSAEPVKAGRAGTSASVNGPACESARERETEPMAEASSKMPFANAEVGGTVAGPVESRAVVEVHGTGARGQPRASLRVHL